MTTTNWLDLLNDAKQNGGPQDFGPVPPGEYQFKILEAETRQTQAGKTKYTIKAQIQSGAHVSRLVWDDLIVSPDSAAAMGFFFRKMKAIGLDENFFATQPNDDQITTALKDRAFLGKVIIDTYGGKERNKIDGYKPITQASAAGFIPPAPQAAAPVPQQGGFPPAAAPAAAPAPQGFPPATVVNPAPTPGPWDQGAAAPAPAPQQAPVAAPGSPWDTAQSAPAPQPGGAPQFPTLPF